MRSIENVQHLLNLDAEPHQVVSLYLDVDGKKFPNREFEIQLKQMIQKTFHNLDHLDEPIRAEVKKDLERIERYVREEFVRNNTAYLVLFACHTLDLFEAYEFPYAFKNDIIVDSSPYTPLLLTLISIIPDALVVMTDRALGRLFLFRNGHLEELDTIRSEVPNQARVGGWKGYEEKRISRHIEEHVVWHLKSMVQHLRRAWTVFKPDVLILSGPKEVTETLQSFLPASIVKHLGPVLDVHFDEGHLNEIKRSVQDAIQRHIDAQTEKVIHAILERQPQRATVGIEMSIDAINAWRVGTLVFSPDLVIKGWRCDCGFISTMMNRCPRCQKDMREDHELLTNVLDVAYQQGADLFPVVNPTLAEKIRGMGTLLRF